MNSISGNVRLRESLAGIPQLQVVAYHVDLANDAQPPSDTDLLPDGALQRLGSAITDSNGSFEITYEAEDIAFSGDRQSLNLLLDVQAPDGSDCSPKLFRSCDLRYSAGRRESYAIQLDRKTLSQAGLPIPAPITVAGKPGFAIHSLKHRNARQDKIDQASREVFAQRMERRDEWNSRIAAELNRPAWLLSNVPQPIRESQHYVPIEDDIQDASIASIKNQLNALTAGDSPAKVAGSSQATEDEIEGLKVNGQFKDSYTANELLSVRFNGTFSRTANPGGGLLRVSVFDQCERESREIEHCLDDAPLIANDNGNNPPANDGPGNNDGGLNIPRYVAGLLDTDNPDGPITLPLDARPTQNMVQEQVDQLQLRGGPADAPAFYDFFHLQLAFDHVWTEAFDQDVIQNLKKIYGGILELGGNPFAAQTQAEIENAASAVCDAATEDVPAEVVKGSGITKQEWNALNAGQQLSLESLVTELQYALDNGPQQVSFGMGIATFEASATAWQAKLRSIRRSIENLIEHARSQLLTRDSAYCRLHQLVPELRKRLNDPHAFHIFAAKPGQRSVNFGLLVNYRQKWQPLNYQAGELVATIPLAPKEVRKFSKRQVVKTKRTEKEVRNNSSSHRQDFSDTSRAESEIIQKANAKTAFQVGTQTGANVGFNVGVVNGSFNGSFSAGFSKDSAQLSEEVKRDFREAVFKASQEYKAERTLEVKTDESDELEVTKSGEISNPNDELTVTYLFYELQRRYRVSEQIHQVTPVVYVAQEVPRPDEINDGWIIAHDWILRRVLLDDSFRPALNYLSTRVAGDEHGLEELRNTMQMQRKLVESIREELVSLRDQTGGRYTALETSIAQRADLIESEDSEGLFVNIGETIFGDDASPEAARLREDAARDAYERAVRQAKEIQARLDREVTSLQTVTEQYTKQLSEHLNRRVQIDRLKVHIKKNILHYMQSIWSYEPPDQRFFRLHQTPVPELKGELKFNIVSDPNAPVGEPLKYEAICELDPNQRLAPLAEIADLDQLLGFKGNYMIFPLKESNCLTDFMMVPYVDAELGLKDPDEMGNWTMEEFAQYVCCLKKRMTERAFAQHKPHLRKQYLQLLKSSRREYEEIIVPTAELFIEALPGAHPLLEDFKLRHRALDVAKVGSEITKQDLENVRLAARLIGGELEDPEIDKRILIEGGNGAVVEVGDN